MKRCTTVIEWLTRANGDCQCKENFNKSAVRQSSKADLSPSISIDDALYNSHQKGSSLEITSNGSGRFCKFSRKCQHHLIRQSGDIKVFPP